MLYWGIKSRMKYITISIKKNLKSIMWLGFFLTLVYLVFGFYTRFNPLFGETVLFRLFDVGHEMNFPTFFSSFVFILLSYLSLFLGIKEKGFGCRFKNWFPWFFLSFLFLFLSLDEFFQIHENLTYITQSFIPTKDFLSFAWVLPYGTMVVLLVFYLLPFFFRIKRKQRNILFFGAFIYLLGALGFEMISAHYYEIGGPWHKGFIRASSIEEILEITGLCIALWGFSKISLQRK